MNSDLLHLFIDMYERRPIALQVALESIVDFDDGAVSLVDQAIILGRAARSAEDVIKRKTLIGTASKLGVRHTQLLEDLAKMLSEEVQKSNSTVFQEYLSNPGLLEHVTMRSDLQESFHDSDDLDRSQRRWVRGASHGRVSTELLRMFANQLDQVSGAIERLDDAAFDRMVPTELVPVFRELHVNAILGNYGTACVLCGLLLERTLQDLLPSDCLLKELIQEAKRVGLLEGHHRRYADQIQIWRNDLVHGRVKFGAVSSDDAWGLVVSTRMLISDLYKDRIAKD